MLNAYNHNTTIYFVTAIGGGHWMCQSKKTLKLKKKMEKVKLIKSNYRGYDCFFVVDAVTFTKGFLFEPEGALGMRDFKKTTELLWCIVAGLQSYIYYTINWLTLKASYSCCS